MNNSTVKGVGLRLNRCQPRPRSCAQTDLQLLFCAACLHLFSSAFALPSCLVSVFAHFLVLTPNSKEPLLLIFLPSITTSSDKPSNSHKCQLQPRNEHVNFNGRSSLGSALIFQNLLLFPYLFSSLIEGKLAKLSKKPNIEYLSGRESIQRTMFRFVWIFQSI